MTCRQAKRKKGKTKQKKNKNKKKLKNFHFLRDSCMYYTQKIQKKKFQNFIQNQFLVEFIFFVSFRHLELTK